jgi:aryl-alcohol dehydrogenase-like predicted oxidoreductase
MQAPMILSSLPPDRKLGVICAVAESNPAIMEACGITDPSRIAVAGAEDLPEFKNVLGCKGHFNSHKLEEELVGLAVDFVETNREVGAILVECSDMPPYAFAIQNAVQMPVFDYTTLVNWLYQSGSASVRRMDLTAATIAVRMPCRYNFRDTSGHAKDRRRGRLQMPSFPERVLLGRSELSVGPLGVSGGYGIGVHPLLQAFDRGVNYFYHGTRRSGGMRGAIREIVSSGRRDELVIALQSYSRWSWYVERSLARGLEDLGIDHADVLLLGWHNSIPSRSILGRLEKMREKGMFHHLAVSGHRLATFLDLAADRRFSVLQIRYNAADTKAERDVFPHLSASQRPGIVAYTATRWGTLLNPRRMPPGEEPLRGRDAYRFVLSNPDFNLCMSGPRNAHEMKEVLAALDEGPVSPEETERFRRVGRFVYEHAWLK